jgi:hypothetical protein
MFTLNFFPSAAPLYEQKRVFTEAQAYFLKLLGTAWALSGSAIRAVP